MEFVETLKGRREFAGLRGKHRAEQTQRPDEQHQGEQREQEGRHGRTVAETGSRTALQRLQQEGEEGRPGERGQERFDDAPEHHAEHRGGQQADGAPIEGGAGRGQHACIVPQVDDGVRWAGPR